MTCPCTVQVAPIRPALGGLIRRLSALYLAWLVTELPHEHVFPGSGQQGQLSIREVTAMTIVAHAYDFVVGVDTHASKHAFSIVESRTQTEVDCGEFPVTPAGFARSISWLRRRTNHSCWVLVSMEGVSSFGRSLRLDLQREGILVTEAPKPPHRAGRIAKNDFIDARRAATSVMGWDVTSLQIPRSGGVREALRILVQARHGLTVENTAQINRLTALVRTNALGIDARRALGRIQIKAIAKWRVRAETIDLQVARSEAVRLAKLIIGNREALTDNKNAIETLVQQVAPALLTMRGIGPVTAAQFYLAWSHHDRIRSAAAFVALAGANPIPASSGNNQRYRLNRGGDRSLNNALHTVVLVRMRYDQETQEYVQKRTAEGKSKQEIMRCLKRYVARQVYRTLQAATIPVTAESETHKIPA